MKTIEVKSCKVGEVLDCGDVLVKRYVIPPEYCNNRNITGENRQGKLLWQVEEVSVSDSVMPFMRIEPLDEVKMKAYNWIGVYYYIYIADGRLELPPGQRPW